MSAPKGLSLERISLFRRRAGSVSHAAALLSPHPAVRSRGSGQQRLIDLSRGELDHSPPSDPVASS
eukprot:5501498-Pleurochrysis_carterae.AAC.1